MRTCKL